MKNLKNLMFLLTLIMGSSVFAQRSTFFDGTYKMDYGNQTMRIENTGGKYYRAYFTGDCNARTLEGRVDHGKLVFPLVGGTDEDMIMITDMGNNKLDVSVRGIEIIRRGCNGANIEGLYHKKKGYSNYNYNDKYSHKQYDRYHEIQYERNYDNHVKVNDLNGWGALSAYDELEARGFREVKHFSSSGKTYRVWYNHRTNQCIKTLSQNKKITEVIRSTHCNN